MQVSSASCAASSASSAISGHWCRVLVAGVWPQLLRACHLLHIGLACCRPGVMQPFSVSRLAVTEYMRHYGGLAEH